MLRLALREIEASDACILVFVKGIFEIENLIDQLAKKKPIWRPLPYSGETDKETIAEPHLLPEHAVCVIIVATNAAASSVAISPICTVISSGRFNQVL